MGDFGREVGAGDGFGGVAAGGGSGEGLPSFRYVDSSATIRQLLNHEAGVFDYINDGGPAFWVDSIWGDTTRVWTEEEVLGCIGPPLFAPGEEVCGKW